jgi:hypothetical protein
MDRAWVLDKLGQLRPRCVALLCASQEALSAKRTYTASLAVAYQTDALRSRAQADGLWPEADHVSKPLKTSLPSKPMNSLEGTGVGVKSCYHFR